MYEPSWQKDHFCAFHDFIDLFSITPEGVDIAFLMLSGQRGAALYNEFCSALKVGFAEFSSLAGSLLVS